MAFVGLMRNYGFGEDWFVKFIRYDKTVFVNLVPTKHFNT